MGTLQDEQTPFDRAVCDAMVASTPDDWNAIVLTIERPEGSTAVGELAHSLNSADHNLPAMPDDSLYEATLSWTSCSTDMGRCSGGPSTASIYSPTRGGTQPTSNMIRLSPNRPSWEFEARENLQTNAA